MKVSLLVEDEKKGIIKIPVNRKELHAMYDLFFMLIDGCTWKTLERNKIDDAIATICKKFQHVKNDIVSEGRTYSLNDKNQLKLNKDRTYFFKAPKWSKYTAPKGSILFQKRRYGFLKKQQSTREKR